MMHQIIDLLMILLLGVGLFFAISTAIMTLAWAVIHLTEKVVCIIKRWQCEDYWEEIL